jgi:O-antigen ligase
MNYEKFSRGLELASKIGAVMIAAAIVLSNTATNILFPMTAVLSLAAGNWRAKFNLLVHNPAAIIFLLFYALFLVGTVYTTATFAEVLLMLRKYDKFLLAIFFIPIFTSERLRGYAINAFLAAIAIMLITSYLRAYNLLTIFAHNGAVEVFRQSIEFNFLMAFAAYLCLFKLTNNRRYRLLGLGFLLAIIYTIFFRSIGRAGYFVALGLLGLFGLQKLKWRGLLMAMLGAVMVLSAAFMFSTTFKTRINAIFDDIKVYQQNINTSLGLRFSFVEGSIKLIKKHPIIGTGTGSFAREYATVGKILTHNPHNEYCFIAVQFGLVGLIILLLLFGIPVWYGRFLHPEPKFIAYGAVLALALGCLANSWLLDTVPGHFYAYFIALVYAAWPRFKST